jgi:hypothetical protein
VWEYCAKAESHSRSGLRVLVRRIKIVLPPSPICGSWSAAFPRPRDEADFQRVAMLNRQLRRTSCARIRAAWSDGVWEYCSKSESHSRSGLEDAHKVLRSLDSTGAQSWSEPLRPCGFA